MARWAGLGKVFSNIAAATYFLALGELWAAHRKAVAKPAFRDGSNPETT
jgi:hypothetical protein